MNDKEVNTGDDALSQMSVNSDDLQVAEQVTVPADAASVPTDAAELLVESESLEPDTLWLPPDTLPGEVFVARREELRWSLEEAATRLKLTPRQVSALEANDFASLPGMASVRGFVRSYAKALELDPEPLLEMLAREPNPAHGPMVLRRPLPTKGFPGRPSSPPPRKSKWRKRIMIAVVFLAAGFTAGYEAYRLQWVHLPPVDDLSFDIQIPDLSAITGIVSGAPTQVASAADQPDEEAPRAEKSASTVASASPAPALQLKLSEDAWVEITTVSGNRIVSQLIKGGSSASFDITEPSVLVVGNASAVEARLRGQLLNLKAVARDNVSKLSIK